MKGFIVYSTYRIIEGKSYVYLFGKLENGESFLTISRFRPYFFIEEQDLQKAKKMVKNLEYDHSDMKNKEGMPLTKIILDVPSDVKALRDQLIANSISCYEADIRFVVRFLIDHELKGSVNIEGEHKKGEYVKRIYEDPQLAPCQWIPGLDIISLDIETSLDASEIFCISLYGKEGLKKLEQGMGGVDEGDEYKKIFIVSKEHVDNAQCCETEKEMLERFKEEIIARDPDILTGWNVVDFDFAVLRDRFKYHNIPFRLGRADWDCSLTIQSSFFMTSRAEFPGRQVLDGIDLLKSAFIKLQDYKLNTAAQKFLGKEKLLVGPGRHEEIQELYKSNKKRLAEYNLHDSLLAYEILQKANVIGLTIQRTLLTGMMLDRVNSSIAALDFVYLSETRKKNLAAATNTFAEREERIKGGHVMESKPGIYENILVLDFKSLYPSIIRTFNIDPFTFVAEQDVGKYHPEELIESPNHAHFLKIEGILPTILKRLWAQRDAAKKEKNDLASYAIKILMNSFFGVLANPMCRFYNLDMANAITHFGQYFIKLTAAKIRERGYDVIYGDTDSVFINPHVSDIEDAKAIGQGIQHEINTFYKHLVEKEYGRTNFMELQFEKTYLKFLMPRIRGTEEGAKKRYAGILLKEGKEAMDFVGMEFVRRDWTGLAKKFQMEFLEKVFKKEDVTGYVKQFITDLKKGTYDDLLIYRKAITKQVAEYTKTTPPHVKAARMLDKVEGNLVEYYMTVDGPQPIQKKTSSIDYDHYIDKQVKPLADSILCFYGSTFDDVVKASKQKSLFEY
ncbi:DNA polymerase II [Candidatus Woesearchaeota archaeon]|nr:DNA polymerase II [Candidatus Woesearchaeota archaeon]